MEKTNKQITTYSSPLLKTFHGNLMMLDEKPNKHVSRDIIVEKTKASDSSVSRWMTGKSLPTVDKLVILAEIYGVSPNWFLTKHNYDEVMKTELTYIEAALMLKKLVELKALKADSITDYFLRYLVDRLINVESLTNISNEKRSAWLEKLMGDYSIPVMESRDIEFFRTLEKLYGELTDDDTKLSVLHAYQEYLNGHNVEEIDEAYQNRLDDLEGDRIMAMYSQNQN